MSSILEVGSSETSSHNLDLCQTVSNTLALIDANESVMRLVLTPEDDDTLQPYVVLLDALASVWKFSPFFFEVLVTSLMRRSMLPPDKLLKWVGSAKSVFIVSFSHMNLILAAAAINAIPYYVTRSPGVDSSQYIGDSVASSLGHLVTQAIQKYDAMQNADEDEQDDATIEFKQVLDLVRCVVRHCLSLRSVDGASSCMLDTETAVSVLARVLVEDTPSSVGDVISLLSKKHPLY
jgi:hypothetical protein